jgi:hypothetical protein
MALAAASGAAHAEQQQERAAVRGGVDQALAQQLDDAGAAEEDGGMCLVEGFEPAERRALGGDRPAAAGGGDHVLAFQPLADVALDLDLEVIGAGEAVIAGGEVAGLRLEPVLPEPLQRLELRGLVVELVVLERHRRGLAIDQHVGRAILAGSDDRLLELVFGAGRQAAVGPSILRRQLAAEPFPEDADDQVVLRRRRNLVLEGLGRRIVRLFPAERGQLDRAELASDPLDDPQQPLALRPDVGRGGNEDAIFTRLGHAARRQQERPSLSTTALVPLPWFR